MSAYLSWKSSKQPSLAFQHGGSQWRAEQAPAYQCSVALTTFAPLKEYRLKLQDHIFHSPKIAFTTPAPSPLDLNNVQGDILAGLPKKTQTYFFFEIDKAKVKEFRTQLTELVPHLTTTAQVISDLKKIADNMGRGGGHLKLSGINLVFSQKGLTQLGINDDIGDSAFKAGMLADALDLGDQGTQVNGKFEPDWIPAFKKDIHAMILVSGDCHETIAEELKNIEKIFNVGGANASIHEVTRIVGDVRPGKEKGHEHFGFLDGISQPAVAGVDTNPSPGQETVHKGVILAGRENDISLTTKEPVPRPSWALDGSFLSFRYLPQLVPEFDTFLKDHPIPGLPADQGSELLGARLVGRWKSGAPVDLAPISDNPDLGKDALQNNNFRYVFPDDQQTQTRCPFAAHIRKTNPRADLEDPHPPAPAIPTESRRIIRRGIQFGPEVTKEEAASGKTEKERGLLFAAYSINITNGFQFIQHSWANTPTFPPFKTAVPTPGFDPIIGQPNAPPDNIGTRSLEGTDPNAQTKSLDLTAKWVVPKGGEYFFSPSIAALKSTFALTKAEGHTEL